MTEASVYPEFDPPDELAKPPKEWTRAEARAYLAWLVDHVEPRARRLLEYLEVADRPDHMEVLNEAGVRAVVVLKSRSFSRPSEGLKPMLLKGHEIQYDRGPVLTSEGLALAADLGLLIAHYLKADFGDRVSWEVGKGPRRWIWYNRPVLIGGRINPFDPVGASVSNAYGVIRGDVAGTIWGDMYRQTKAALDTSNANG